MFLFSYHSVCFWSQLITCTDLKFDYIYIYIYMYFPHSLYLVFAAAHCPGGGKRIKTMYPRRPGPNPTKTFSQATHRLITHAESHGKKQSRGLEVRKTLSLPHSLSQYTYISIFNYLYRYRHIYIFVCRDIYTDIA